MATAQEVDINVETGTVVIENVSIQDPDVVEFLEEHDPDDRVDLIERACRVGFSTLQLSETSKDLEHVKHEFEEMEESLQQDIDDVREELDERFGDDGEVASLLETHLGPDGKISAHLEDAFGEDGQFVERLDDELGEDGERIQDALDPDKEGTPTHRLKSDLKEEIRSVRDKLTAEEVREEEQQDSWKGGEQFEEDVGELLEEMVYNTQDIVQATGDEEGEISGSYVGDYVLELGETDQRIVVEAKSEKGYTQPKIKDEMEKALENRDAEYGIFVMECEEFVPDKVGYFQEYDQQILAVSLREDLEDSLEPGFLRIAHNWTSFRLLQAHVDAGNDLDPQAINGRVEEIRDTIDRFQSLKTKCSDIESSAQEIKNLLNEIRTDVTEELDRITAELSKAG